MLKFLKALLPFQFSFEYDNGATVETLTSSLQSTVTKLKAHAEKHDGHRDLKAQRSNDLYLEALNHADEAHQARSVADKIGALLS